MRLQQLRLSHSAHRGSKRTISPGSKVQAAGKGDEVDHEVECRRNLGESSLSGCERGLPTNFGMASSNRKLDEGEGERKAGITERLSGWYRIRGDSIEAIAQCTLYSFFRFCFLCSHFQFSLSIYVLLLFCNGKTLNYQ